MSNERYPADLTVTDADLDFGEIEALLKNNDEHGYSTYHMGLSKAARETIEQGEVAKGKALWLLADACSMMLRPSSIHQPFEPWMRLVDRRSAVPEDFIADDLEFFSSVVGKSDNARVNARLADALWLLKQPKDVKDALNAIDYYGSFPLDHDGLLSDGKEGIERAIRLSHMLRGAASDKLTDIKTKLLTAFGDSKYDEG